MPAVTLRFYGNSICVFVQRTIGCPRAGSRKMILPLQPVFPSRESSENDHSLLFWRTGGYRGSSFTWKILSISRGSSMSMIQSFKYLTYKVKSYIQYIQNFWSIIKSVSPFRESSEIFYENSFFFCNVREYGGLLFPFLFSCWRLIRLSFLFSPETFFSMIEFFNIFISYCN